MPVMRDELDSAIVERKETANVLPLMPSAGRDTKHRIGIARGVARKPQTSPTNRTVPDLSVRAETIERSADSMPDSPVRKRESVGRVSVEFLSHGCFPFVERLSF